jgi:hypothetical protein
MAYDPQFLVPMTAALLSHKHRSWQRPSSKLAEDEVTFIAKVLRDGEETSVENHSKVTNLMEDTVYTTEYKDIKQQIILLRLLTKIAHTKEVEEHERENKPKRLRDRGNSRLVANP